MSHLNSEIQDAIDAFDVDKARQLIRDALPEADAETYYLASQVALNDDQKQRFLEQAVEKDPFHEKADVELQKIKGNGSVVTAAPETSVVSSEPAPQPTVEEPVAKPEPQAAATPAPEEQRTFVVGTISGGDVSMYTIPTEQSIVRTNLRKGTKIYLIARDDLAEWYQAIYDSPIGQDIIGWVSARHVSNVNVNGNPIQIMDLPITQFQLNTRDDVKALIKAKGQPFTNQIVIWIVYLATLPLGGLAGLFLSVTFTTIDEGGLIFGPIFAVMFGLPAFLLYRWASKKSRTRKEGQAVLEQIERLNQLQLNMRTDYEKMQDDQRINMALNSAMNLGSNLLNTAASNYIKDRKEITVKRGK